MIEINTEPDEEKPKKTIKLTPESTIFEHLKFPPAPVRRKGTCSAEVARQWFETFDKKAPKYEEEEDPDKVKERKDRIKIYVYRLFPRIIREPKYIARYDSLADWSEEKLLADHGGGEYGVTVNEDGQKDTILEFKYVIPHTTFPPILNWSEVSKTDKANATWLHNEQAEGRIKIDGGKIIPIKKEDKESQAVMSDTVKLMEVSNQQFKDALAMAKEMIPKAPPPSNDSNEIKELLRVLINKKEEPNPIFALIAPSLPAIINNLMNPKPVEKDTTLLELLKESRERSNAIEERMQKLMDSMLTKAQATTIDPVENIMKTLEMADRIRGKKEEEEDRPIEKKSTLDRIIESVGPAIAPMLAGMMGGGGQMPHSMPQNGATIAPQAVPAPMPQVSAQPPLEALLSNPMVAELLTGKIKAGVEGHHFADELVQLYGLETWSEINKFSPEQILTAIKNLNPLRLALGAFTDDYLLAWIKKFANYRELIEKEENEEEE